MYREDRLRYTNWTGNRTLNQQKGRDVETVTTDAIDRGRPLPVARLISFPSATSIGTRNDHRGTNNAHHESGFIKVVKVAIEDAVLGPHIEHQPEPRAYHVGIFTEGPLEVVATRKTCLELLTPLDEAVRPKLPGASCPTL